MVRKRGHVWGGYAVDVGYDVAHAHPCLKGRAHSGHVGGDDTIGEVHTHLIGHGLSHVAAGKAYQGSDDAAPIYQTLGYTLRDL